MEDPILDDDEVILLNLAADNVVNDWATLIEAKSGASSFDIKDSTLEFRFFEENTIFTKGVRGNKREIRRKIKTILDNCTFPEVQKRKATECYAENPEYAHLPIDKMDPRKLFLYDVVDEGFICANELESKGMLKSVKDVEFDWKTHSTFRDLNFMSKQGKVLEKETKVDYIKRIPNRRPRPKPATPAKKATLKNREQEEFYPEREKDLTSERRRRENEMERQRREREKDYEEQKERLYAIYKTSLVNRELDLGIQSQFPSKDTTDSRAQNSKPQQSERHYQKSSHENQRKWSFDRKERERERRRDQSPESPRYHHKKSKRRHRDIDRSPSPSSERSIFSPSSTSSFEERSIPKRHFSSKRSPPREKARSPPARRRNEDTSREQKWKHVKEVISIFSSDSEQSQGHSIPIVNKKTNPREKDKTNRKNSSHLESIPEETHLDSDIIEITEDENKEIAKLIEDKINRNNVRRNPPPVKGNLEIIKVQEEIFIPRTRLDDDENYEIAQLMEENINKSRNISKPVVKIEEDILSQYKEEMGKMVKEIIHKELQQIGIGKQNDKEYEDLGKILEEKIIKSKVPQKVEEEEDFVTQYKKAMSQVNPISLSDAEIIIKEEIPSEEDTRDLAQLLEENIRKGKKSPQSKKDDKVCNDAQRPLLIHDVIEDHSQDIYDPELAQLIEEKINSQNRDSFSQLKKATENEHNPQENKSIQSQDNNPNDHDEIIEKCSTERDDQELAQLIEVKTHSSLTCSPQPQKPNENLNINQENHDNRCSSNHNEKISPRRDDLQEKSPQSKKTSPHDKKVKENSHSRHEKQSDHDHHHSEAIEEEGEILKEKVSQSKHSSSQLEKTSQDDHIYEEKQPIQGHQKRSPHHHGRHSPKSDPHYQDNSSKKMDHQEVKLNSNRMVEDGKSIFTSNPKASTDRNYPSQEGSINQFDTLNQNRTSQDNSEVLVIEDNEVKEELASANLATSYQKDYSSDSGIEEIDISELYQTQCLNKEMTDLKLTNPRKINPNIINLGTARLPPKEKHHESNSHNEPSHPPNFLNNPTQMFNLPPVTQPIDFGAPPFLNLMSQLGMNQMGNFFGNPYMRPNNPFQYSPLMLFPPMTQPFGSGNIFAGNFMPPPQMQPLQQYTASRNSSETSSNDEKEKS